MKTGNLRRLVILTLGISLAIACKKEEPEPEPLPSLGGSLKFELPSFIAPKEKITVTPQGVKLPEGRNIGYSWIVSPIMATGDTTRTENDPAEKDGTFTYTFPDTLGTFTVGCSAFCSGYYTKTASKSITTVQRSSLNGVDYSGCSEFVDSRDGEVYKTIRIGSRTWFCNNLSWKGTSSEPVGHPFQDSEAINCVVGRFYTLDEALTACPEGWRLPDNSDWLDLGKALSDKENLQALDNFSNAAEKMMTKAKLNENQMWGLRKWSHTEGETNASRFNAVPLGFANIFESVCHWTGSGSFATYWSSDANSDIPEQYYYRYISYKGKDLLLGSAHRSSFAANVRCVKE